MEAGLKPVRFADALNQISSGPQTLQSALSPGVGVYGESTGSVRAAPAGPQYAYDGNALPGFVNKLLGDQIAATKRKRFYDGFAAARAGKTVAEIHKDQPWFAGLFGQTNYEAGATAYTAQASVAELVNEMNQNMGELRQKTPEDMGNWLNEKSDSLMTGDIIADAVIQKSLLDQAGPMMDMQAKANFAWKQENLARVQYDNTLSQARVYESGTRLEWAFGQEHPDQKPDPTKAAERERMLFEAFQVPQGQTYDSYVNTLGKFMEGAGREGLWHSVSLLRKSPMYTGLPVDQQESIEKRLVTAQAKWRQNLESSDDLQEAYQIRASGAAGVVSPSMLYQSMTDFNRKFQARYGSEVPYFDEGEMKAAITGNAGLVFQAAQRELDAAARIKEKAADNEAKQMAEALDDSMYAKAAAAGNLGVYSLMSNYDEKRAERSLQQIVEQNPVLGVQAVQANFTNSKMQFVSSTLKKQVTARVEAGAGLTMNDSVRSAYAMWNQMFYSKNADGSDSGFGPAMANAYFEKYADDMFSFDGLLKAGVPEEDAYQKVFGKDSVFGQGDLGGGKAGQEAQKALDTAVGAISPGWFARMFGGGEAISPSSQKLIAHHASRYYERMLKQAPHLPPEILAQRAVQQFTSNGGEIAGKYAWMNGPSQKPLSDSLRMPKDVFGTVFDTAVTNKLRKSGLQVQADTSFEMIRVGDDKDGPRMMVIGYASDGTMKAVQLNAKDFNAVRDQYAKENYQREQPNTEFKVGRNTL